MPNKTWFVAVFLLAAALGVLALAVLLVRPLPSTENLNQADLKPHPIQQPFDLLELVS